MKNLNELFRAGRSGVITDDIGNITHVAPRTFPNWCEWHVESFRSRCCSPSMLTKPSTGPTRLFAWVAQVQSHRPEISERIGCACTPGRLAHPVSGALFVRRGVEVVAGLEVLEQPGVRRFPSENPPGRFRRGWIVQCDQHREEAEMFLKLVVGHARGRQVQVVADALGDLAHRDTFVADCVKPATGRRLFECRAVQVAHVEGVPSGPAIAPIARVPGEPLALGDRDESPREAVAVQLTAAA
jgi:hypothetical protein